MRLFALAVLSASLFAAAASAQPFTWNGHSTTSDGWNDGLNWVGGLKPPSAVDTALIFTGTTRLTPQQNIAPSFILNALTFDANAGAFVLGGNGALDFRTNSSMVAPTLTQNSATAVIVNNNLTLTNDLTVGGRGNLTLNGAISGAGGLTMSGAGTLTFGGSNVANTYTGLTSVTAGTLQLNKNSSILALAGPLSIGNAVNPGAAGSAVVKLLNDYQTGFGTNVAINSDGLLDMNSHYNSIGTLAMTGGELRLGGTYSFLGGDATINASTTGAKITSTNLSNNLSLNGASRTFTVVRGPSTYDLDVQAGATAGTLVKAGAGVLRLAGTTNGNLSVTLNAGTLALASNAALGSNGLSFTLAGGTVTADGGDRALSNPVRLTGSATIGDSLDGTPRALSFTGATTLTNSVTLTVNNTAATSLGAVSLGANTLTFAGTGATTLSGAVTGSGGLTLSSGALTISGAGSYTGTTAANGGTLTVGTGGSLTNSLVSVGPGGTFTINGGSVNAGTASYFALSGGSGPGNAATANLLAGTLSTAETDVGNTGINVFNQSGGTHTVTGGNGLTLGVNAGSNGSYNLSGTGQVSTPTTYVGVSGSGTFNQSGGTHTVTNGNLVLAFNAGSSGTYNLSGTGQLTTGYTSVGLNGSGTFTQTGGTHTVGNILYLGYSGGSSGADNLSGGTLTTASTVVGNSGSGTFTQTGGTHTVGGSGRLFLGINSSSNGTYNLGGSGVLSTPSTDVGDFGTGTFNQTGGTHTVSGSLDIGFFSSGVGTYNLNGGTLTANVVAGSAGASTFNFNGGTLQANGDNATFVTRLTAAVVQAGGAKIDSNGHAITIGQTLLHDPILGNTLDGGLTKLGAGTLTLTAANTYTGGTTIASGTLNVNADAALGAVPAAAATNLSFTGTGGTLQIATGLGTINFNANRNVFLADGATATIDTNGVATALSGAIAGGALTKVGAGTLTLTGINTSSGTTTVSAGVLQIGAGGTAGTLGTGNVVDNASLVINRAGTLSYGGSISGSGGVTQAGSGTFLLTGATSYTGPTTVSAGTLTVGNGGSLSGTAISVGAGAALNIVGGGRVDAGSSNLLVDGSSSIAAQATLSGNSSTLATSATVVGNTGLGTFTQSGGSHTAFTVTLGQNPGSSGTYTLSGGTLSTQATFVGNLGTGVFTQTDGLHVASNQLSLGQQNGSSGTYNLNGGTVQAGRVDGRNGTFNFNGGILQPTRDSILNGVFMGGLAAAYVQAGGAGIDTAGHDITISQPLLPDPALTGPPSIGLAKFSAGTLTLTGANTYTGPTYIVGGTLRIGNGGTTGTPGAGDIVDGTSLVFNRSDSLAYSGAISGSGSLTKLGAGTLTLSGANTFTGGLTVGAGMLSVAADANLGDPAGAVTLQNSGRLAFTGASVTTGRTFNLNTATLAPAAGGSITYAGATVNGGNLGAGGSHVFADGSSLNGTTALPGTVLSQSGGTVAFNATKLSGALTQTAGTLNFNGGYVTAAGSLTVNGTVNTSGVESTGLLTVNPGGVVMNTGSALTLGSGSRTFIGSVANPGGKIDLGGQTLNLTGGLLVNNGGDASSGNGVLNGKVVVDYGGLAKGSGYYANIMTQNGGQYLSGNSPGRGQVGTFAINPGGTLQFDINDATGSAGPQPPTTTRGWSTTQVFDHIDFSATSAAKFNVNVVSLLAPLGDSPGAIANFDPSKPYTWTAFQLQNGAGITGSFDPNAFNVATAQFSNPFDGRFSVALQGQNVNLMYTPVPEPAAVLAIVAGACGAAGWVRWWRRQWSVC